MAQRLPIWEPLARTDPSLAAVAAAKNRATPSQVTRNQAIRNRVKAARNAGTSGTEEATEEDSEVGTAADTESSRGRQICVCCSAAEHDVSAKCCHNGTAAQRLCVAAECYSPVLVAASRQQSQGKTVSRQRAGEASDQAIRDCVSSGRPGGGSLQPGHQTGGRNADGHPAKGSRPPGVSRVCRRSPVSAA